jgi:nicotinamide phosphoribosyltransferase
MSEKQYVLNMIDKFAKPGAIFAMVADSYNVYEFCKLVGGDSEIKERIDAHGATGGFVVIRPDSGDPIEVIPKMLYILEKLYGAPKNAKGYKVLNNVRVIWGDGINAQSLETILRTMVDFHGYSADNFAFGMGGGLLQQLDRDTLKFAMKCSSIGIRVPRRSKGEFVEGFVDWRDVFKDPITDPGKASKKGRVTLWESGGEFESSVERPQRWTDKGMGWDDAMQTYFEDGEVKFTQTFEQVRANSNI